MSVPEPSPIIMGEDGAFRVPVSCPGLGCNEPIYVWKEGKNYYYKCFDCGERNLWTVLARRRGK